MFALQGLWLIAGFAICYIVGVTTSQWAKDTIKGVPADLRRVLNSAETAAVNDVKAAKAKAVAEAAAALAKPAVVASPVVVAVTPAVAAPIGAVEMPSPLVT